MVDRPDHALFDLDPAKLRFTDVVCAALLLREVLEALGLDSLPKTTGGRDPQVHVPLARRHSHEEVRAFCRAVAVALVRASGGLVTGERAPARQRGVRRCGRRPARSPFSPVARRRPGSQSELARCGRVTGLTLAMPRADTIREARVGSTASRSRCRRAPRGQGCGSRRCRCS